MAFPSEADVDHHHGDKPDEERGYEPKLLSGRPAARAPSSSTAQGRHAASNDTWMSIHRLMESVTIDTDPVLSDARQARPAAELVSRGEMSC
jgi:hypothetical protein